MAHTRSSTGTSLALAAQPDIFDFGGTKPESRERSTMSAHHIRRDAGESG